MMNSHGMAKHQERTPMIYAQKVYCIFMYKYVIPKKEQNVLHSTYKFSVTM